MGTTKAGTLDVAAIEERPWLRVLVRDFWAKRALSHKLEPQASHLTDCQWRIGADVMIRDRAAELSLIARVARESKARPMLRSAFLQLVP